MYIFNSFAEGPEILTIRCGENRQPVSKDLRCVYDVDADLNVNGCLNLNHLDNCCKKL